MRSKFLYTFKKFKMPMGTLTTGMNYAKPLGLVFALKI